MVAQTVASRDGCRCEIVHIGQVVICTDHAVAAQYAAAYFVSGTRLRGRAASAAAQPSPVALR
jgi:hypothetical protein